MFHNILCLGCSAVIATMLAKQPSEEFLCFAVLIGLTGVSLLLWSIQKGKEEKDAKR